MGQDYVVGEITKDQTWPGNSGDTMRTMEMLLPGAGQVKVTANTKFPAPFNADKWPVKGDTIHGTVDGGKFKFEKPAQQQAMNGGSEAVQGGKPPPEYWEAKDRRIQRQHSQEMALRFAHATGDLEELHIGDQETVPEVLKFIRRLADWFDNDVIRVSDEVLAKAKSRATDDSLADDDSIPF